MRRRQIQLKDSFLMSRTAAHDPQPTVTTRATQRQLTECGRRSERLLNTNCSAKTAVGLCWCIRLQTIGYLPFSLVRS